ncbi:MAG: hypothetical protein A2284_08545 [Deltaproteobacteria bacterium RIFOXYA12_FULL_61_11]|nr:MAG: hypothetical protein A2284_08545 [Deltaproteobacteria bacterium RIFOXYA12_FULL_61_11]
MILRCQQSEALFSPPRFLWAMVLGMWSALGGAAVEDEQTLREPRRVVLEPEVAPDRIWPRRSSVIEREDFDDRAAVQVDEVLRGHPQLDLAAAGTVGESSKVRLHGVDDRRIAVSYEGFRLNSPLDHSFDFNILQAFAFERIEVLGGPWSVLYGSDSAGGAIVLVPRARVSEPLALAVLAGARPTLYEQAYGGTALEEGGLFLGAARHDSAGVGSNDRSNATGFALQAELVRGQHRFSAFSLGSALEKGVAVELGPAGFVRDRDRELQRIFALAGVGYDVLFGDEATIKARAGWLFDGTTLRDGPEADDGAAFGTRDRGYRYAAEVVAEVQLAADHLLRAELEVQHDRVESAVAASAEYVDQGLAPAAKTIPAYSVVDRYRPLSGLTLETGVRFDHYAGFPEVTPRAGAEYRLTSTGTAVVVAVGKGFRAPSPLELSASPVANASLEPEQSIEVLAGLRQALFSERLQFDAEAFHARHRGLIQLDPGTERLENLGRVDVDGIDLQVSLQPWRGWQLRSGCKAILARDLLAAEGQPEELPFQPRLTWSVAARGELDAWRGFVEYRVIGSSVNHPYVIGTPGLDGVPLGTRGGAHNRLDLTLAYRFRKVIGETLELRTKLLNAFDERSSEVAGYAPSPREIFLGAAVAF